MLIRDFTVRIGHQVWLIGLKSRTQWLVMPMHTAHSHHPEVQHHSTQSCISCANLTKKGCPTLWTVHNATTKRVSTNTMQNCSQHLPATHIHIRSLQCPSLQCRNLTMRWCLGRQLVYGCKEKDCHRLFAQELCKQLQQRICMLSVKTHIVC